MRPEELARQIMAQGFLSEADVVEPRDGARSRSVRIGAAVGAVVFVVATTAVAFVIGARGGDAGGARAAPRTTPTSSGPKASPEPAPTPQAAPAASVPEPGPDAARAPTDPLDALAATLDAWDRTRPRDAGGRLDAAPLETARRALVELAPDPRAIALIARCLELEGRLDEALAHLDEAVRRREPDVPAELLVRRAWVRWARSLPEWHGRFAQARVEETIEPILADLRRASELPEPAAWSEAATVCADAMPQTRPIRPPSPDLMARVEEVARELPAAEPSLLLMLSDLATAASDFAQAEALFARAIALRPGDPALHARRALLIIATLGDGRPEDERQAAAIAEIERARALDPGRVEATLATHVLFGRAVAALRPTDRPARVEAAQRLLAATHRDVEASRGASLTHALIAAALIELARALAEAGQIEETTELVAAAREHARAVAPRAPGGLHARLALAAAAVLAGESDADDALEIRRLIELAPDDADLMMLEGDALAVPSGAAAGYPAWRLAADDDPRFRAALERRMARRGR